MPWFLGVLNYRLGINLDILSVDKRWEEIKAETEDYWIPFDNVHEVLTELRDSALRMGVISNWDTTAKPLLQHHGLIDYFDHCIISSEVGINKPDPEIFSVALQRANVDPQECIYVGDNYYDDAVGSREAGMQTIILNRFGNFGVEEIDDTPIIQNLEQIKNFLVT